MLASTKCEGIVNIPDALARAGRGWQYISLPRGPVRTGRTAAGTLRTGYRGPMDGPGGASTVTDRHHSRKMSEEEVHTNPVLPGYISDANGSDDGDSSRRRARAIAPGQI